MELAYPGDFLRVVPWGKKGDLKCDGYLPSARKLFQAYAPTRETETKTLQKLHNDFDGARVHWREHFDRWVFLSSSWDGVPPEVAKALLNLPTRPLPKGAPAEATPVQAERWAPRNLIEIALQLNEDQLVQLVGPVFCTEELLNLTVPDLLPLIDQVGGANVPQAGDGIKPVSIEKLQGNRLSENALLMLRMGNAKAHVVAKSLSAHTDPRMGDRIAEAFAARYQMLKQKGVAPDEIFMQLVVYAGGTATTTRQAGATALVAHLFEQCDVFEDIQGAKS